MGAEDLLGGTPLDPKGSEKLGGLSLESEVAMLKKHARIEKVENPYKKSEQIWSNTRMDKLRREECLCRNCERMNDKPPYASCPVAGKLYQICLEHDMAMAITRCGAVDEKGELMYKPAKP